MAKANAILDALTHFEAQTDDSPKGKAAADVCSKVAEIVENDTVNAKLLKAIQDKDGDKSEKFFINRLNKAMNAVGTTSRTGQEFVKTDRVHSASRAKHATLGCGPEPDAFMGTRLCSWVC